MGTQTESNNDGVLDPLTINNLIKKGNATAVSDGKGLTFTLSKSGTASWVLRYQYAGKQKELTLGRYPELSLADARIKATTLRAAVLEGQDIAREKRKQIARKANEFTLTELIEDYRKKRMPELSPNTIRDIESHFKRFIIPKLGSFLAREIGPDDAVTLIEHVGERNSASVAKKVHHTLSALFTHGQGRHAVTTNPCRGLSVAAIVGTSKPVRKRIQLTETELNILFAELKTQQFENARVIRILLATAVRNGEMTLAKWKDIDFENGIWTIPASNIKTVRGYEKLDSDCDFKIPLEPQVITWFKELKIVARNSVWVLPARAKSLENSGLDVHCSSKAINAVIDRMCARLNGKIRRFTPHDLRSTARSYLTKLSISEVLAERYLNHKVAGITGLYDRETLQPERKAAMQKLLAFYDCCEQGKSWSGLKPSISPSVQWNCTPLITQTYNFQYTR